MSCSVANKEINAHKINAKEVIDICIDRITQLTGKESLEDADHIYVDIFPKGYMVAFTKGEVGTFSKRSKNYRQILACGVSENQIVFLGSPLKDALIDRMRNYPFDDYDEDVMELLFKLKNGTFEFCCSQKFDEKNIKKNNPDYPKPS